MPIQLPHNFPSYDTSLSLLQKKKIWNSFSDLQPYIEDYYVIHTQCLAKEGNETDVSAYIFLKQNIDLQCLSDQCRKDWKLDTSSKHSLIVRGLPETLIKEIYPKDTTIHCGGSVRCFHDYVQDNLLHS